MNVDLYLCTLFTREELGETLCYLRDTMQRKWSPCFLVLSMLFVWNYTTQWSSGTVPFLLDGTQFVAVRGLYTKKFQPECGNEESSTERCS